MTPEFQIEKGEASSTTTVRPSIVTQFTAGYVPPFDVAAAVDRMVESVPPKFLIGLSEIVLTNTAGLPRKLRRSMTKSSGSKVRIAKSAGLYHQAWNNRPAWIEIYVDNMLRNAERGFWLKSRLFREQIVGGILFHEIGHHVHFTVRPEHRDTEDVADVWKVRLQGNYARRRFFVIRIFVRLFKFLTGPLFDRLMEKQNKWELQKGWMSRAEFEERSKKKKSRN